MIGGALAVLSSILLSAKAIVAKLMYAEGLQAIEVVALRMLLAGPVFAAVSWWTWRQMPRLSPGEIWRILLLGLVGYYGASTLDFLGLQYISAGLERLILFLTPTLVILIGVTRFGRRPSPQQWWSMALAYAGILLVVWHDLGNSGPQVALGVGLVFVATALYAVYLSWSGELVRKVGPVRLTSLAMCSCTFGGLAQFAALQPWESLLDQSPRIWQLAMVNASLCTVVPVYLFMVAVARIGAAHAAQVSMVGPVSTLFLAWWWLSEPISALQLMGTALVLAGILVLGMRRAAAAAPPRARRARAGPSVDAACLLDHIVGRGD